MAPGSIDDTVARLSLWCRHTPRGLAFVEFHSEPARQRVIEALSASLPTEAGPWHELSLTPAARAIEVVDRLVAGLEARGRGVVSVDGFGVLFEPGDRSAELVSALNFNRERLAAPPSRQIWWLPTHVVEALLHGAPDLYSWFKGRWHLTETVRLDFDSDGAENQPRLDPETDLLPERLDDARRRSTYLVERFERAIGDESTPVEVIEDQLLRPAVRALREAGAEREAKALERRLQRKPGGDDGAVETGEASDALSQTATRLHAEARYAEAEPLMRRALKIDEAQFGARHPKVAIRLNNLAAVLYETGRLAEAEPLMRRALEIDEATFGPQHPKVATRLDNLALFLRAANRPAEAEPLMRRTLEILEASLGPGHRWTITVRSNLEALRQAAASE